jgi:hypothetical protein
MQNTKVQVLDVKALQVQSAVIHDHVVSLCW